MYASFGCGESWSTNQGYLLFLLDRLITSETFHDVQIAVAWATGEGGKGGGGRIFSSLQKRKRKDRYHRNVVDPLSEVLT